MMADGGQENNEGARRRQRKKKKTSYLLVRLVALSLIVCVDVSLKQNTCCLESTSFVSLAGNVMSDDQSRQVTHATMIDVHHFFSEVPQFGSLRPLPKRYSEK